jgi:hydrogenase maturation protein HypF
MGRLFDAVASLVGLRHSISYEAQAAIDLEQCAAGGAARGSCGRSYRFDVPVVSPAGTEPWVFDPAPVLRAIVADHRMGIDRSEIALGFHGAVVDVMAVIAGRLRTRRGIDTVALSGGVFQNALLVDLARRRLEHDGFAVLTHRTFPTNDGGLALGQAMLGLARHRARTIEEN